MILKSKIFENQLHQQNFAVSRVQQLCKLHLYPDLGDKRDWQHCHCFMNIERHCLRGSKN